MDTAAPRRATARILTYNVHRWLGTDRQVAPGRIAEVIASCGPTSWPCRRCASAASAAAASTRRRRWRRSSAWICTSSRRSASSASSSASPILTRHPSRLVRSGRLPSLVGGAGDREAQRPVGLQSKSTAGGSTSSTRTCPCARGRGCPGARRWSGRLDRPSRLRRSRDPARRFQRAAALAVLSAHGRPPAGTRSSAIPSASRRRPSTPGRRSCGSTTSSSRRSIEVVAAAPVRTPLARVASDHFPADGGAARPQSAADAGARRCPAGRQRPVPRLVRPG